MFTIQVFFTSLCSVQEQQRLQFCGIITNCCENSQHGGKTLALSIRLLVICDMNTYAKTSRGRCKPRGWAAMSLEYCQKQSQIVSDDPFPPLQTNSTDSILPSPSSNIPSFSSIVQSFADFPPMVENVDSSPIEITEGYGGDFSLSKLQRLHSWADQSLVEDVMTMVNNDTDKATALLREMFSSNGSKVKCEMKEKDISDCYDFECKKRGDEKSLLESTSDLTADVADLSSTLEDVLIFAPRELMDSETATANMKLILGHLKSFPVEPEWEENDVYMSHRRDALKMMRLVHISSVNFFDDLDCK